MTFESHSTVNPGSRLDPRVPAPSMMAHPIANPGPRHAPPTRTTVAARAVRRNLTPIGMGLVVIASWLASSLPMAEAGILAVPVAILAGALVARAK